MTVQTKIIKLDPSTPLPCSIRKGNGICKRPATVAYAYPSQHDLFTSGTWIVQPICPRCVKAHGAVYGIKME